MENPFLESLEAVEEEIAVRLARENLLDYELMVHPNYKASKFHTFLCEKIQKFITADTGHALDILLLSVPPQFGKSLTVTETLPAWMLGHHPERKWILASYNSDFASSFGRKNKEKCEQYNPRVFPNFKLADSPCNNIEFETTKKGGLYSAGLLAGITGHSAYYVIIDDPIKTAEEAMSPTTKEKIWTEYLYSVRSRLAKGGKIIVIQTRWSEDDLYGRIALEEDSSHVEIINIPCECDDPENDPLHRALGEGLCPEIGKGTEWLKDFKTIYTSDSGSRAWNSLYQGRPTALEGNMIKKEWWQYYTTLPANIPYKILSVDAAFKDAETNDFVAIQEWCKMNGKYYLKKYIKQHLNFVNTLQAIRDLKEQEPDIMFILIEDKANGSALINILSSEMEGVIPVKPEGGKVSRVNAVSPLIERGDVFLPQYESFTADFVTSCAQFPNGAHDDDVDAMSQALNRMAYVDADVVNPEHLEYREWKDDQFVDYENASDSLKAELLKLWKYPLQWVEQGDN